MNSIDRTEQLLEIFDQIWPQGSDGMTADDFDALEEQVSVIRHAHEESKKIRPAQFLENAFMYIRNASIQAFNDAYPPDTRSKIDGLNEHLARVIHDVVKVERELTPKQTANRRAREYLRKAERAVKNAASVLGKDYPQEDMFRVKVSLSPLVPETQDADASA